MIGKIYKYLLDYFRSKDFLTQKIWKLKIEKKVLPIAYDLTSLVLKKSLDIYKKKQKKIFDNYLDMGCGQLAILGQYKKKIDPKTNVASADIYHDFLENAQLNARANNLKIEFIQTNMFENIKDKYDLITFNPPYIPLDYKKKDIEYDKISFAGTEGTDAISFFLKNARNYLKKDGLIFLGVNLFYVPKKVLFEIIDLYGFKRNEVIKKFPNKSIVVVISDND
tara:strand:+ start:3343 stop:4011 length:669 start_codon:yes stop_codon:yes gene_type:complete